MESCPRCSRKMEHPFVALSRVDNETYICPDCGTLEALENMTGVFVPDCKTYWVENDQYRAMLKRQGHMHIANGP